MTNNSVMCFNGQKWYIFTCKLTFRAANALVECYLFKSYQFGITRCKVQPSLRIFIRENKTNRKKTTTFKSGKKIINAGK